MSHITLLIANRLPARPIDFGDVNTFPSTGTGLSPRHLQTLAAILEGDSEKHIARRLGISQHTVHVYVKAIYRRFNVESRPELARYFIPVRIINAFKSGIVVLPCRPNPDPVKTIIRYHSSLSRVINKTRREKQRLAMRRIRETRRLSA